MVYELTILHRPIKLAFLTAGFAMLMIAAEVSAQSENSNSSRQTDDSQSSGYQKSILKNGSFEKWNGNRPNGWVVEIGARNGGDRPQSKVRKIDGPALELSGDQKTLAWNSLSQMVPVSADQHYQIDFQARAIGLKREGRQFDNCYVGYFQLDRAGNRIDQKIWQINNQHYQPTQQIIRPQRKTAKLQLLIFLSKTGRLNVKELSLSPVAPSDSFDILVQQMGRHYSYFDKNKTDWSELTGRYRSQAMAAKEKKQFIDVVRKMLSELSDVHVWIQEGQKKTGTYVSRFDRNFDFGVVDKDLVSPARVDNSHTFGKTKDGLGYARIMSLPNNPDFVNHVNNELGKLFDAPGIILDLRRNGGGSEFSAQQIASLFADNQYTYARNKVRSGPQIDDFVETSPRMIAPSKRNRKTFKGPVVCLIGPGAVSSAEAFALMFKCLPNATLVGLPTRGASGNPAPIELPNGIDIWFSRWVSMTPEGTAIEGRGVTPDIEVAHGAGDPAWQRAQSVLQEMIDTQSNK